MFGLNQGLSRQSRCRPRRRTPVRGLFAACAVLAAVAACTYRGAIDQPYTIKFTWFSYLSGDDIRTACAPGVPDRYRFVYNGNYDEQLRSYEITADGGGGAFLRARAMTGGGINLARFRLSDPLAVAGWTVADDTLGPADVQDLESALADSGAFGPPPVGLRLASEQFYWVMSACRGGSFHFNAWLYPSARFKNLRFPGVLLRHDGTGVPVNPPRETPPIERVRRTVRGDGGPLHFDIEVGADGLVGPGSLF